MNRSDYAFPFRIDSGFGKVRLDAGSGQAAQTDYEAHVEQMIRQVLMTSPGERIDLPEFGCGLRRLLFAPNSDALAATTQLLVLQALNRWLAGQITVKKVEVSRPDQASGGSLLLIQIDYVLIETLANKRTIVRIG